LPFDTNYLGTWIRLDVNTACSTPPATQDYCGIRGFPPNEWCYGEYFRATDWISFDLYPKNEDPALFNINDLTAVMDRIAGVYPGGITKPRLVYIEASNIDCRLGYPNQWHVVYEAVEAVIAGARGIIYFPHKLRYPERASACTESEVSPDGTTLPIQQEMTRLNTALGSIPGSTMQSAVYRKTTDPYWFESGTTFQGQIKSGARADSAFAYFFTENDSDTTGYTDVVRFHGVTNCAGKVVTVLNDVVVSADPYVYQDRALTLDAACQTTAPESWSARRYHIYRVPLL
jgi:hypothetical protein